jgi:hypothetical protein
MSYWPLPFSTGTSSAPAERIAITVQEASRRAGVLKRTPIVVGQKLGTAGPALGMGVHPGDELAQPVGGDFYVGVDEDEIIGLHLREGAVVAARETVVLSRGIRRTCGNTRSSISIEPSVEALSATMTSASIPSVEAMSPGRNVCRYPFVFQFSMTTAVFIYSS